MPLTASDLQNVNAEIAKRLAADCEPDLANIRQNAENGVLEARTQHRQQIGWFRAIGERLDAQDGLPAGTLAARAATLTPPS